MRRRVPAGLALVALLSVPAAAAARHHAPPPKPSLRISGISVNQQNVRPGTSITLRDPVNACYGIGGADQDPRSVQVFVFLHAVKIPRSAPITLDLTTPWDHEQLPNTSTQRPTFGSSFFPNRGHAGAVFGGAPGDFYRFDDEGTGSNVFNGRYVVTVTAKVGHSVLRARGAITVACR